MKANAITVQSKHILQFLARQTVAIVYGEFWFFNQNLYMKENVFCNKGIGTTQ